MNLRIKEIRTAKDMSRAELARAARVTWAAVAKWEKGASLPDLPHFVRIAEALGVTMDELIGQKPG